MLLGSGHGGRTAMPGYGCVGKPALTLEAPAVKSKSVGDTLGFADRRTKGIDPSHKGGR